MQVEDATSKKLVPLAVSFGTFERTILVGMKQERENPKEVLPVLAMPEFDGTRAG